MRQALIWRLQDFFAPAFAPWVEIGECATRLRLRGTALAGAIFFATASMW
ncbi:hypothetical protein ABMC89_03000 [Sulfitobacter sp. HNIBRBA3233]